MTLILRKFVIKKYQYNSFFFCVNYTSRDTDSLKYSLTYHQMLLIKKIVYILNIITSLKKFIKNLCKKNTHIKKEDNCKNYDVLFI